MCSRNRTSEEVLKLVEHAKLNKDDLLNVTQSLYFDSNYCEESDVKLLEINNEILRLLENGEKLVIRGDREDPSVLCTQNKTYEVREAETSNSLVLVPGLKLPSELQSDFHKVESCNITSTHYKYLELRICKPKLRRIRNLLEENLYSGRHNENENKPTYSLEDFLDRVQASEGEIKAALAEIQAYKINGRWRLLDFDYQYTVLSHILGLIESNSWSLDAVPKSATIEELRNIEPEEIIRQCFEYFLTSVNIGDEGNNGNDIYKVIDKNVSRIYGEMLLRNSKKFNLDDFKSVWQQSVPDGLITSLYQLEGLCIVDSSSPPSIRYFPASELPEDPQNRFRILFELKEKWTMDEIKPFLNEIAANQAGVSMLLAKYARTSTQEGYKCYSSKHSK